MAADAAAGRAEARLAQLLRHVAPLPSAVAAMASGCGGCECAGPVAQASGPDGRESEHAQDGRENVVGPTGAAWYPVEVSRLLKRGKVTEVVFWGTSVAVWRGSSGTVYAIENRCAHRMLRLSKGHVYVW